MYYTCMQVWECLLFLRIVCTHLSKQTLCMYIACVHGVGVYVGGGLTVLHACVLNA